MEISKQLELKDEAINNARKLTDNIDQQYWYQEGHYDAVDKHETDLIERVCQWIESHSGEVYDDNLGCVLYVIDLDAFRNAMNEPKINQ